MPCDPTTFVIDATPDGGRTFRLGSLEIEHVSGDDITGKLVLADGTREPFTGKCRPAPPGGQVSVVSLFVTINQSSYLFVGSMFDVNIFGGYYRIGNAKEVRDPDPGDTGTWGGSQTRR